MAEVRFRSMGVDVHVIVDGSARLLSYAVDRVHELDRRWSRFDPCSEVSRLNATGGQLTVVSPDTFELVRLGIEGYRRTGGAFDPSVLGDVIRAGYDRDFDRLADTGIKAFSSLRSGIAGTVLLPGPSAVALPAGVGFDPGGLGKGLAADLVTRELLDAGAAGACANVGGDLRVRGTLAGHPGWPVAVDDPDGHDDLARFALHDAGLATTTTVRRQWTVGGELRHHLIDPGTGRPAVRDLVSVSVVAPTGWEAEVLAKAGLLAGAALCLEVVAAGGGTAIARTHDGRILASPSIPSVRKGAA